MDELRLLSDVTGGLIISFGKYLDFHAIIVLLISSTLKWL